MCIHSNYSEASTIQSFAQKFRLIFIFTLHWQTSFRMVEIEKTKQITNGAQNSTSNTGDSRYLREIWSFIVSYTAVCTLHIAHAVHIIITVMYSLISNHVYTLYI